MKTSLYAHLVWAPISLVCICVGYFVGHRSSEHSLSALPTVGGVRKPVDFGNANSDQTKSAESNPGGRAILTGEEARVRAFEVLSEPNRITRMRQICELLDHVTPENWRDILDAFVRQTGYEGRRQRQEWELALERVGQIVGADAITEILKSPREREHQWAQSLLIGWAESNPNDAVAWFQKQSAGTQSQLRLNLLTGIARTDAKQALALTPTQSENVGEVYIPSIVMASIQHGGFREAEELLSTISSQPQIPNDVKSSVFRTLTEDKIFSGFTRDDPSIALTWFDSYVGQDYVGPEVTRDILANAAKVDAEATLKWLDNRTERLTSVQAAAGFNAVAQTWIAQSPEQFAAWMNANGDHPQHDAMAESAVNLCLRAHNTDQAKLWSQTINDPQLRARMGRLLQQAGTSSRSQ